MPAFVGVCRWASPILRKKQRQTSLGTSQVIGLGIQSQQHRVGAHTYIKLGRELFEKGLATDALKQ